MEHPTNGRAIIYGRVSTQSDTQANSLAVQTLETDDFSFYEDFKRKWNYEIFSVYSDDKSGTSENRKGFQEMLTFLGVERKETTTSRNLPTGNIKKKKHFVYEVNEERVSYVLNKLKINYILCKNTSRWTREGDFRLINLLRVHSIYIYFKDENIDTYDKGTDTILGIIQQLDKSKSTDTSIKVRSGLEASIRLGKIRTNSRIYGYEIFRPVKDGPSYLKPIPEEALTVRTIFQLYTGEIADDDGEQCIGSRQICNYLERRGIKTREHITKHGEAIGGTPFSISSIKRILANEKYCGYVNSERKWDAGEVFNRKSPKFVNEYPIIKSDYILPLVAATETKEAEYIITLEQYQRAAEIRRSRSEQTSPRGRNPGNSIYNGKIKCAVCGSWFTQNGDKDNKGAYHKKMNCSGKKRHGIAYCNNSNLTFREIEKRYEDFCLDFNDFLDYETKRQQKEVLKCLYVLLSMYYNDTEKAIRELNDEIKKQQDRFNDLLEQRAGLGDKAKKRINQMLDEVATEEENLTKKRDEIIRDVETLRPHIDNMVTVLMDITRIDKTKKYTVEEIKNFDIIMIAYPEGEYKWEMQFKDYQNMFTSIPGFSSEYYYDFVEERTSLDKTTLNTRLIKWYDAYGIASPRLTF